MICWYGTAKIYATKMIILIFVIVFLLEFNVKYVSVYLIGNNMILRIMEIYVH